MLFWGSHVLENKLTDKAQGNLQSLFDATPEHAVLVKTNPDGSPDMAQLTDAKARDVAIGSLMLIRPGEQVICTFDFAHDALSWIHHLLVVAPCHMPITTARTSIRSQLQTVCCTHINALRLLNFVFTRFADRH